MTTKNTDLVTNFEAKPLVFNNAANLQGRVRTINGTVELAVGDLDAGDIVMLAPIPTNARVLGVRLASDDLDSNGSPALLWDIGLHTTAGVAKDADVYATDITLGQAATAFTEYAFEARGIELCGQAVWQDAGDTADPGGFYLLSMTVSTAPATAQAGTLSFIVEYAVD